MGKEHSTTIRPCTGSAHRMDSFTCMSPNCEMGRIICRNKACGYKSTLNPDVFTCKLCRLKEQSTIKSETEEQDIQEQPKLKLEASVTYNRQNNRFDYTEEFFKFIADADDESKAKIENNFRGAADAISMEFEGQPRILPPLPQEP